MGSLSYSLGAYCPVRKITSLISVKPEKKYSRIPSTLHDCLDDTTPEPISYVYRPWLILVLILPLLFFIYRVNELSIYHQHGVIVTDNEPVFKAEHKLMSGRSHEVGNNSTSKDYIFDEMTEAINLKQTIATVTTPIETERIDDFSDVLPHGPPECETHIPYKIPGNLTVNLNVSEDPPFMVNPLVAEGGYYKPPKCRARHRVAIIVPYRHREKNLAVFLTHMHKFLIVQQIEYQIFIIEQNGQQKFNRGRLLNAGFDETKGDWDCFIFHDVDLLPLDTRILYTCSSYPRHMSTTVYVGHRTANFTHTFGGVTAMSEHDFVAVNGYSNRFWGWGAEDNDMFWRIRLSNLPILRYHKDIARYIMLPHEHSEKNTKRYELLKKYSKSRTWLAKDGLSSLNYVVVFKKLYPLFTHIIVEINPYKDPVE